MGSKAKQCSIHPRHNRFCIQHHEDLKLSAASTSLKSRTFDITRLSKAGTFVMNRWSRDICFVRVMTSGSHQTEEKFREILLKIIIFQPNKEKYKTQHHYCFAIYFSVTEAKYFVLSLYTWFVRMLKKKTKNKKCLTYIIVLCYRRIQRKNA